MNSNTKLKIKEALRNMIQQARAKAYECGSRGDNKGEDMYFRAVNDYRNELYVHGFGVESFASPCYGVHGVDVKIIAHRGAKWGDICRVFKCIKQFAD